MKMEWKEAYSYNQKKSIDISGRQNEDGKLREFDSRSMYWSQERNSEKPTEKSLL